MFIKKDFTTLKRSLKKDASAYRKVRIALLGDSATQFLSQALRATGLDREINLELWEADFDQIDRQILDPSSELYNFKPEIVIIFRSSHKLLSKYNKLYSNSEKLTEIELLRLGEMVSKLDVHLSAKILFYNYTEIDDSVFGSYSSKISSSYQFQLRKLNYELMNFAVIHKNFFLIDLSSLQNRYGRNLLFNTVVYINTEMVLSIEILPEVAGLTLDVLQACLGQFKKCVILDLDNTLWGGIIGDDGIENIQLGSLGIGKAFTEFQYWLKKLKNRGIILAVCSKNNELVAKEPFERHPDMPLSLEDIAVFVANWDNKVDNIRHIQKILNIGFDSMVFLDDNPFERNMVRENIPQLAIPELPEDPANYLEYLYSLNLFETASFSAEDHERTKQYQIEAQRTTIQQEFANEEDFLKSLDMLSIVEPINKFNTPRVSQLTQRSNQFNLRTIRYSESEIALLSDNPEFFSLTFTLKDKFGDNGLISVIILRRESNEVLFIETWLMSCRVLKRGMEEFVLNTIVNMASQRGFTYLKGEYIPTPKNEMVKNHYGNLGFKQSGQYWLLPLTGYQPKLSYIKQSFSDGKN